MKIITTNIMPDKEYVKEETKKTQIVLHHTVSDGTGKAVEDWFESDKGASRVAVAYVIDKSGNIIELFDPKFWAWHIGKGSTTLNNKSSIGIEIVCAGQLWKKGDKYFWFDGTHPFTRENEIFDNKKLWRGSQYFAKYTNEQISAVKDLLNYLFQRFPTIEKKFSNTFDYNKNYFQFNGVVHHANLRPDKTDLSPAYPINELNDFINGKTEPAPIPEITTLDATKIEGLNLSDISLIDFIKGQNYFPYPGV